MTNDPNTRCSADYYNAAWSDETDVQFEAYPRNVLLASLINNWPSVGLTMVDLGCGTGIVSNYFAGLGYSVAGIDDSTVAIAKARQRLPQGSFSVGSVEQPLPFATASVDLVFWGDNVEHLFDPMATLLEIRRILKPTGRLIVSCPNVGHWRFRLIYLFRGAMPRNEGHANPPWRWNHIRFFTPNILRAFLVSGGFFPSVVAGTHHECSVGPLIRAFPSLFATILLAVAEPVTTSP